MINRGFSFGIFYVILMCMKTKSLKMPILIGAIIVVAVLAVVAGIFLLRPKKADAHELLLRADTLSKQNLCLAAIVREDPGDTESWRHLLTNYAVLGADAATIEATRQASGQALTLPEVTVQPEEPGNILGTGGIIHGQAKVTDYDGAGAVATDGETVYYTTAEGIFADYHGLIVQLTAAKAERMVVAENGLYYLNATARRVQYIARDGHRTETVSELAAADFAFADGVLWIAGTDGTLYKDGVAVDSPAVTALCVAGTVVYAAGDSLMIAGGETLLHSPVFGITGGGDGCIYYIDQNGYPAKLDPTLMEASILAEKTAVAVGYSEGKAYYLNEDRKVKKL